MADRGAAAALPAAEPSTAGVLLRAVRPVTSAQTWLALIHLLAGVVTGSLAFVLVAVFLAVGLSTVWLLLVGVAVIGLMLRLCEPFAEAERARFAVMLGVRIPAPPPAWVSPDAAWSRRVRQLLATPSIRRQFCYALLRFPLSLVQSAVVFAVWSFAVALLGLPLFGWLVVKVDWHISGIVPGSPGQLAGASAVGLLLLFAAPHLTQGLAAADTAIARYLIGPGSRVSELERSRARVVDASEAERRRIERDLHDGAQQRLVSLAMNLGRAKAKFGDDPEGAKAIIDQAHGEAKQALAELRNLVRGVHPPVLTDRGLDAAISGLTALSPVPVSVRADLSARPPASVEAIAYFVVAEALTNIAKHAHATHAEVTVDRDGDVLSVEIRDDGIGGADLRGQGLAGLADRIAGVDGRLSVRSPAGGPTVIRAELPCES